jgi:hypothetical protein
MGHRASPTTIAALLLGALASLGQLVPGNARAAERVALVIGNASYKEAPLRNPVNDARAMATTLEDLGFEVIRVENADKETIERAIIQFAGRLDENSSGLFYYAGHGVQVRGRNYLVPVDAKFKSEREARIEAVSINLVLDELDYAGNRLNVVILDACRNNPFERRLRGASRGLAAIDAARGTLIAYATSPGSVAQDGEGSNGLYTEELLKALQLPGLEVEDVFKQVRINVSKRTDYGQIPWESSSLTGEFVLNRRSPAASQTASIGNQNEAVFWESVETSGTPEAYRVYLQQFPNGVFASLAAYRISELEGKSAKASPTTSGGGTTNTKPVSPADGPPYVVAIFPPVGKAWLGSSYCVDESSITKEIHDQIYWTDGFKVDSEYDGTFGKLTTERLEELLWRSQGVRKHPDFEQISEYSKKLDADAVLLYRHETSGGYCARMRFTIYFYDLRLQKVYTEEGSNTEIRALSDSLIEQFLKGRSLAQSGQ